MTTPDNFRYSLNVAVRYGDMDTLGHVNNAKYLTYLEQSRIGYFRHLSLWDGGQSPTGLILARVEVDYRAPVTLDDVEVTVWTRVTRFGNKSFDIANRITFERGGQTHTAVDSKSVVVAYDYAAAVPVAIPEIWREKIGAFEGL